MNYNASLTLQSLAKEVCVRRPGFVFISFSRQAEVLRQDFRLVPETFQHSLLFSVTALGL